MNTTCPAGPRPQRLVNGTRRVTPALLLLTLIAMLLGAPGPATAAPGTGGAHTGVTAGAHAAASGTGAHTSTKKKNKKKAKAKRPARMKHVEKPRPRRERPISPYKKDRGTQVMGTRPPNSAPCSIIGTNAAAWPSGVTSCH